MVFPWVQFVFKKRLWWMSDILLLAVKEFKGKLRQNDGSKTAIGDLATLTANTEKDMYLASAKISAFVTGASGTATITLNINGVVVDTWVYDSGSSSVIRTKDHDFPIGFKVAATQIIKLEVTALTTTTVYGEIQCFEETTGVDPFADFR